MASLSELPPLPPKLEALREEMEAALRAALPGAKPDASLAPKVSELVERFRREHAERFEDAYREAEALGFTGDDLEPLDAPQIVLKARLN